MSAIGSWRRPLFIFQGMLALDGVRKVDSHGDIVMVLHWHT